LKKIETKDDFKNFVKSVQDSEGYVNPIGFGFCRVDLGQGSGKVISASFPLVNWNENFGSASVLLSSLNLDFTQSEAVFPVTKELIKGALKKFSPFSKEDGHKNIDVLKLLKEEENLENFRLVFIFKDEPLQSVEATYLKLYALSLKKAPLRSLNLNGAFGVLPNVAWSGNSPIELNWLRENEMELKIEGKYPNIDSVDKFPRFLQHIIPEDNTRILEASKVRMGASLHAGTTVMPGASYINFNAGTTGVSMVEGRISSSAIVGDGSDVGGGASILGVLSGTNGNPISIGKNSLLGANSVCGIPLGDGCIIDAGVSILEGTKISISEVEFAKIQEANPELSKKTLFKGVELSGANGVHFRQESETGKIVAFRSKREIKLNEELH
jgi:2,3,4,5-tetrahydropyridine-2-carboxylate N-succinyltransferase